MKRDALAALTATLLLAPMASAQDTSPVSTLEQNRETGVRVFEPDFFANFNPVSAWDMVQAVPGFTPDDGESVRGFGGTAGNILIDGERLSTKQGLVEALERIPVAEVERIELIRGAVAGYDMRGQTVVVNVVRRRIDTGNGTVFAQLKAHENQPVTFGARVSYSTRVGAWSLSGNLTRDTNWVGGVGPEVLSTPDGALILRRDEVSEEDARAWAGGAEASASFGTTSLRLVGEASSVDVDFREASVETDNMGDFNREVGTSVLIERQSYEFGGDVEHRLNDQLSAKLIVVTSNLVSDLNGEFRRFSATGFDNAVRQLSSTEQGETVARAFASYAPNERHSLELGAERAFNFIESALSVSLDAGAGPVAIDIPGSNTRVEEVRHEIFASWVWQPFSDLTVEPELIYEFSTIEQIGEGANSRDLDFWKPALSVSWQVDQDQQFSLSVERVVVQLDFDDFVSSTDINDDLIDLGNPQLEPDKTWRLRARWEQRFWQDGSISLTGTYEVIEDLLDLLPVTAMDGRRFDAPGNIGEAWRASLSTNVSLPLGRFGVPGSRLDARFTFTESEVDDPVTGETRPITGQLDYSYSIGFRQDFTDQQFSWGVDVRARGESQFFRLSQVQTTENSSPSVEVFVETTRLAGLTTRLELENATGRTFLRERRFFDAPRDVGQLTSIETRENDPGHLLRLSIRGAF